ncbi:WXG100 family type VII secretion target [Microbacterium soli]|uniref:ESAT-6-like protein n=1 Tax=Microbacterium soli TaxID=446075 RepID=A0ABP7N0A2_9MICO
MSESAYKVEPDTLDIAATDITSTRELIDGHQLELDQATAELLTQWTGAASEAWGRTQAGWQSDLGDAMAAATALSTAVREAADGYRDADDAVSRAWSI